MNAETIKELRRLDKEAAPPPWRVRPVLDDQRDATLAAVARNCLRQLLDEREALLAAAKHSVAAGADEFEALHDAINKAEAP